MVYSELTGANRPWMPWNFWPSTAQRGFEAAPLAVADLGSEPPSFCERSRGDASLGRCSPWGLAGYALVFFVWAVGPIDVSPDTRNFIGDVAFVPPGIIAALLAFRAAATPGSTRQTRRAWAWLGFAYLAYWAGDVLYFVYDVVANAMPFPSLADVGYLVYYPLLLVGLVSFPRVLPTGTHRLRFALDVATVAVGGAMVVWYFVLGPIAEEAHPHIVETLVSVAYPVGDLVLLLGLAITVTRAPRELPRQALALLLAGLVVSLVADLAYGVQNLDNSYESGRWVDALYVGGWALLGASAYFGFTAPGRPKPLPTRLDAPDQIPLVPYLAVALGYGMLVAAIRATWSPTVVGLVVGAGGLTALVVARQVIGVRENLVLVAERQARRSEARFRSLVQNASDLIVVLDKTFAIQYETPSVERILGYRFEDLHKTRLVEMVHPDDVPVLRTLIVETAASGGSQGPVEIRIARSDGSWIFLEASATNLLDDPDIAGLVLTIRNVDDRKRLEVRLTHQASHDSLTGLANRALINERVSDALAAAPIRGESVVVLFIDLDDLKTVNDSLGHDSGDRALIEVSRRIRASTRTADLVGRVAGDEFAVLLESPGTEAAGVALSERILSAMDAPYELDGLEIQLGVSIGVAVSAEGEDSSTEVLRNADCAMYAAKTGGKGRYVVFKPGMQAPARERLDVEAALRHALKQHQLDVYFQPIVELARGQISGAEALLRWHRPDTGLVLPGEFIHIAEETGLIVPIGAWVLEQACLAAASWPTVAGTTKPPSLAVNLSARQLQDPHLVELVADVVARTRIDPARLVLEVTESLVIQDPEQTIPRLHALKALGVRLAIDDFGTGYSSLSYLRTLPVDEVKVDRSFVADLDRAMGSALVHGIVELGHSLGLDIVAEGIEYVDQTAALVQFGCEYGQGFHFARPMPLPEFTRLLISGIDNHRRRTKPRQLAAASRADAHERTA